MSLWWLYHQSYRRLLCTIWLQEIWAQIFIKETCAGKPLSPEDGGYPNEVNTYDPNPHGTDEDEINEIIRTKLINHDRLGIWWAIFIPKGKAAGGTSKRAVARRILQLARPPWDDDRYVNWRETLENKPEDEKDEDEDGVEYFGVPGLRVLSQADNQNSNSSVNQNANQRTSNRINQQARRPQIVNQRTSNRISQRARLLDETIKEVNNSNTDEILRRVVFTQISKGKFKGQWRAFFLSGGSATTGKTQIDVAKNIIANGKKINIKTGEIDVRYLQWDKYIMTHKVPIGHASPTSGNVESVEEDEVCVEVGNQSLHDQSSEGESEDETSIGDAPMHDEEYSGNDEDGKVVSCLL